MQGDRNLHQGKLTAAVQIFEQLLPAVDKSEGIYFNIQRGLVKAYQQNQQLEDAIALCQSIAISDVASNALWGQNFLAILDPNYHQRIATQPEVEIVASQSNITPTIKLKTLSQFKQYCQDHLLEHLQALEHSRKRTLITMFVSALLCLIVTWFFCLIISGWLRVNISLSFYLCCLTIPGTAWIIFCRGCIQIYGIGFKRNIIESIVNFIADQGQISYAAHLFLENKRRTILMQRLVEFNQKAGGKVYLSFVDGFVYVAIPYRHNLFEPRLFKTMMSFTPLKQYFQDLQLMIGIVEDLNLNRRIWG